MTTVAVALVAGCSPERTAQWGRLGLPEAASDRAEPMGTLWVNTWIAAFAVGALVWGLIIWAIVVYRKRGEGTPRQTRYNLPMEIMYTAVPFVIIGVLFYWTVRVQNDVLEESENPDLVVNVVGEKWSWVFNYETAERASVQENVYDIGTVERIPTLYLPVNETVRFNVSSPDVIHSFWVPAFYFKRDLLPGQPTSFELTPTKEGVFAGKCAELCGTYHSAMIFEVHVVSAEEFDAHLRQLKTDGQVGVLEGHADQNRITGLEQREEGE
ncbi:MAG TPA: cytochrome c oxidase subunit II [Candidatus Avipropionibacterium avicola]|uniref:Cytochrome c oxidase subunit 2 n=1 Tax=Candidatus Avipropionibacterium avicola TaxID=2840701 RepID=A0A9D1GY67_9ACTN|nr:cytochrome c oxidase subunit II [Candidatus Avipropionibacterium avicola]